MRLRLKRASEGVFDCRCKDLWMSNWIMDWWKGISPVVLISFIYWWKGIGPVVLICFIYMFISFILEKLKRWKGNNNRSFLTNIKRLKEQNVWHQDYLNISTAMKITEYRKPADNIISNKTWIRCENVCFTTFRSSTTAQCWWCHFRQRSHWTHLSVPSASSYSGSWTSCTL